MSIIQVEYETFSSTWFIRKALEKLNKYPFLSFDIENAGVYSKTERKEALKYLTLGNTDMYYHKLASVVSNNSGLSHPTLINVTHFVFGISKSYSIIIITDSPQKEFMVWNWIANTYVHFYVHNTLFDFKVMHSRIGKLPRFYDDTALMVKTLINNSHVWKSKVGLKDLMDGYYDPAWALMNDYEPEDLHDKKFLNYTAIDGAATYYLHELIQKEAKNAIIS